MSNVCTTTTANPSFLTFMPTSQEASVIAPVLERAAASVDTPIDADFSFTLPAPFELEHGVIHTPLNVQARITGPCDAPVILVLGGISANRHPCEDVNHTGQAQAGWWPEIVGENRVIDTTEYRVLSFDFLAGETVIPHVSRPNPDPLHALPTITPADQASIAAALCDYLELPPLYALVGASYGGMIGLNFAQRFPEKLERLIVLCASHRAHPMGVAWRSIQRKIVQFGLDTDQPDRALSLARELGMTTYRTAEEFSNRFASKTEVKTYLENRGQEFIGRMTPARYLMLSESIDHHAVDPQAISVPTAVIGFRQDQLVPVADLHQLTQDLPHLTHFFESDSLYGHDAFLKEISFLNHALSQSLKP